MANNKNSKVLEELRELVKILGVSRTLRKLEEILDDEVRFNSYNLQKRGEFESYAICQKIAYGVPAGKYCGDWELKMLAEAMDAHNIGYVISDMLASYTRTQKYVPYGYYSLGNAICVNGTVAGEKIA